MILRNEIGKKAREYGIPVSTIERDYAQNWLLKGLSSLPMVLKGGTGIRKVYIENYRFSDDLDFTMLEDITKENLAGLIKSAVIKAREESGINFFDDLELHENINGFEAYVYFQILQRGGNRTKIKIDISKRDNEKLLLPIEIREIIHPYSDALEAKVKVYALEEIMAEKIRSLFQRTRPRDLYDVWYLWDKINLRKVFQILPEKFSIKNVKLDIEDLKERKYDFKNAWESSLGHQLKHLPNFENVFSFVLRKMEMLSREK